MDAGSHSISSEKKNATMHWPPLLEAGFRCHRRAPPRAIRRPSATETSSSRTGHQWTWTLCTTCARRPRRTRSMQRPWRLTRPGRPTGSFSCRRCSITARGSSPSGRSRRSLRMFRLRRCGHIFFSPGQPGKAEAVHSSGKEDKTCCVALALIIT